MPFVYIHAIVFACWMLFVESAPWPTLTHTVSPRRSSSSTLMRSPRTANPSSNASRPTMNYTTEAQERLQHRATRLHTIRQLPTDGGRTEDDEVGDPNLPPAPHVVEPPCPSHNPMVADCRRPLSSATAAHASFSADSRTTHNNGCQGAGMGGAQSLIVDDEDNLRSMLAAALRHNGFVVSAACTGREALKAMGGAASGPGCRSRRDDARSRRVRGVPADARRR